MKRKADFVVQNICGEIILLPLGAQILDLNGLIRLNETGAYLWKLLEHDVSTDELATALVEKFDVDSTIAYADVQFFIREIEKMGVLG